MDYQKISPEEIDPAEKAGGTERSRRGMRRP